MSQKKFKVLITHPEVPDEAIKLLEKECEITKCDIIPSNRQEILSKIEGIDGILWASHERLNAEIIDKAGKQLKVISCMSAGIDYVDVDIFKKRGIPLGHSPGVLSDTVAELAIGLMISAARRFHEGRLKIETNTWENYHVQWMLGQDIRGSTVGFIGFGGISQSIGKRLQGFNCKRIIYANHSNQPKKVDYNAELKTLDTVLKESDFIFVACPLTPETKGMINEEAFNKMKSNCVLINIARGDIVNQDALYNALKSGKIFSAGIDVMTPEPLPNNHPLLELNNIVITPHLASATLRCRTEMAVLAANNVLNGLKGLPLLAPAYKN